MRYDIYIYIYIYTSLGAKGLKGCLNSHNKIKKFTFVNVRFLVLLGELKYCRQFYLSAGFLVIRYIKSGL